jgi:hypothetical protein
VHICRQQKSAFNGREAGGQPEAADGTQFFGDELMDSIFDIFTTTQASWMINGHGGNIFDKAKDLGCGPMDILDMSSNVNCLMTQKQEVWEFIEKTRAFLAEERQFVISNLQPDPGIKFFPSTTSFILAKLDWLTAEAVCRHLLNYRILIRDCRNR